MTRYFLLRLAALGLVLIAPSSGRAEMLHSAFTPSGTMATQPSMRIDFAPACAQQPRAQATTEELEQEWGVIREELTRCVLESMLTMFFIRSGTPPPPPPPPPPPVQQGGGGDPPPPPPTGGGETPPPSDPGPPKGTPEPASLVTALLGAGLASWFAWHKRRKHGSAAPLAA